MNLEVYDGENKLIYQSDESWLHPLFSFENYVSENDLETEDLFLKDKIIGRGAAVLIIKIGIKKCYGKRVSKLALPLLEEHNISIEWENLVDKINCKTEDIITDDLTIEQAYKILYNRAKS